jgi:nicotinamide phosphoribosyltransferase
MLLLNHQEVPVIKFPSGESHIRLDPVSLSTYQRRNGIGYEIFKDPATDDGTKKSATGLLHVGLVNGEYVLTDKVTAQVEATGELETVLLDGEFFTAPTITEIRNRLQLSL